MTPAEETRHLSVLEGELRREFDTLPAEAVHEAVQIEHKVFDRAPIRDFVPVLVGRAVRKRLSHHMAA